MINTGIIGSSCLLGHLWTKQRFFDYLFDPVNWELLRNQSFGELLLIDPILWDGPIAVNASQYIHQLEQLTQFLHETKVERLTFLTTFDLLPEDADESTEQLQSSDDPVLNAQIKFRDYINLQFGRVLTVRLPEILGLGQGFSPVIDTIINATATEGTLPLPLLERHQFYPISHIIADVDTAWKCGLFSANLASAPVTTFEIFEQVAPELQDRLPIAHPSDPMGSNRKSQVSYFWHDPMTGYIIDKESIISCIKEILEHPTPKEGNQTQETESTAEISETQTTVPVQEISVVSESTDQ